VFVKICGITNPADAEAIIAARADALGFNFWPGSERYLEPACAAEWITELPDSIIRVAVLVNPSSAYAKEIAAIDGIDCCNYMGPNRRNFA
jgi:phosphoribosylanthranilate isomerase